MAIITYTPSRKVTGSGGSITCDVQQYDPNPKADLQHHKPLGGGQGETVLFNVEEYIPVTTSPFHYSQYELFREFQWSTIAGETFQYDPWDNATTPGTYAMKPNSFKIKRVHNHYFVASWEMKETVEPVGSVFNPAGNNTNGTGIEADYTAMISAASPFGWWKLDETEDTDSNTGCVDSSGNGNHLKYYINFNATLNAGFNYTSSRPGLSGVSKNINGVHNPIRMAGPPPSAGFAFPTNKNCSIQFALKLHSTSDQNTILGSWNTQNSSSAGQFRFYFINNQLRYEYTLYDSGSKADITQEETLIADVASVLGFVNWNWIAFTSTSGGAVELRVNNSVIGTATMANSNFNYSSGSSFCIGAPDYAEAQHMLNGAIDEVQMYHRVLTGEELTNIYDQWASL